MKGKIAAIFAKKQAKEQLAKTLSARSLERVNKRVQEERPSPRACLTQKKIASKNPACLSLPGFNTVINFVPRCIYV